MPRRRTGPWKRKSNGCWYTTEPGSKKYVKLAEANESYETALQRYHDYHATYKRAEPGPRGYTTRKAYSWNDGKKFEELFNDHKSNAPASRLR